MKPVSPAPQMDSWCVCVTAEHARRSHAARERSASPPSKWTAVAAEKKGWSLSTAASTVWRKPSYTAPLLRPPVRRSSAARRTCATATSADTLSCRCFPQVGGSEGTDGVAVVCSQTEIHLFVPLFYPVPSSSEDEPEGEPVRYRVETLALFVLGPVVVLALLSVVSVLACRRLHHGRLQRLQEFDTEQGAIDGLISSNVGDSTLAVRDTASRSSLEHKQKNLPNFMLFPAVLIPVSDFRTCCPTRVRPGVAPVCHSWSRELWPGRSVWWSV